MQFNRKLAAPGALAALAAMVFSIATPGCGRLGSTGVGGNDDFVDVDNDMNNAQADLRGLPSVDDLPPVAPEARGRLVADVSGPRHAHVAWGVSLPFTSATIQLIGADGTVYVEGMDGLGAVRNGKLAWAFRTRSNQRVTMADDGRIWFAAMGGGGYFCLNRDGKGGLLPMSFKLPPDASEPHLVGCSGNGRWLRGLRHGDVPLDYECTRPQAVVGPDEMVYVATAAPDLRGITLDGTGGWKLQTPCAAQSLLAGPGGRALFSCQDLSLHYVENGAMKWTKAGDGTIDEVGLRNPSSSIVALMDRNGTVYFIDHPGGALATRVHALNATGAALWTLDTKYFNGSSMQFDGQGRIYLSGMRGMHSWLVCISD